MKKRNYIVEYYIHYIIVYYPQSYHLFLYARNYSNEGVMSCCYYFLFSDNLHQACTSKNITSLLAKALVFGFSQSSIAFIVKLPVTLIKNKFVVARTESYCYRKFITYIS